MKVRTIRDHSNEFGNSYFKSGSAGPVYDVPDADAASLIKHGYVENADVASAAKKLPSAKVSVE